MSDQVQPGKVVSSDSCATSPIVIRLLLPESQQNQQTQTNASNHLSTPKHANLCPVFTASSPATSTPLVTSALLLPKPQVVALPVTTRTPQSKNISLVTIRRPFKILCKNCGVYSSTDQACSSCKKPIPKSSLIQISQKRGRLDGTCSSTSGFKNVNATFRNTSTFYGKSCSRGLSEFTRYLQTSDIKTQNNLKRPSVRSTSSNKVSDCIMISDSDDEETANKSKKLSSEEPLHSSNSVSAKECDKRSVQGSSVVKEVVANSCTAWQYEAIRVPLTSVRIGQFKAHPSTCLTISGVDLSMSFPDNLFRLKWFAVKKLEICCSSNEPCIYIDLVSEFVATFRHTFGMIPNKFPYYDPIGPDSQKYIIFYLERTWSQDNMKNLLSRLNFIRLKLKKSSEFISEISSFESNSRQLKVAEMECMESEKTLQLSSPAKATRSSTRTKSNVVCLGFDAPRVQLAIYPPPPAKGGISVTNEDEFCLNDGEFLNDVIIDFYLKYAMEELLSAVDRERSHVFSCFFYKRLTQLPQGKIRLQENKSLSVSERRHMRVRKWTRGVDLFSKDFIFIPINDASHWYLAVVCFPGKIGKDTVNTAFSKGTFSQIVVSDVRSLTTTGASSSVQSTARRSFVEDVVTSPNKSHVDESASLNMNGESAHHPVPANQHNGVSSVGAQSISQPEDGAKEQTASAEHETNVVIAFSEHLNKNNEVTFQSKHAAESSSNAANSQSSSNNNVSNKSNDEETAKHSVGFSTPCILIFDSLRGCSRSKTAANLREYLSEEWKFRKSAKHGNRLFDSVTMRMCSPHVPQQDNYSDCGVFLLHYVEKMFENPIKDFTLPIKSLQNWFDPAEVKQKRSKIRDIIEKLRQMQST